MGIYDGAEICKLVGLYKIIGLYKIVGYVFGFL